MVLPAKWSLHEVDDVEQLCVSVIRNLDLTPTDRDDLLAYLLGEAWRIYRGYEPSSPPRFGVYLKRRLHYSTVDWLRHRFGRTRWAFRHGTHERPRPIVLPLTELDGTLHSLEVDDPADQLSDLHGILGDRVSETPWEDSGLGQAAEG